MLVALAGCGSSTSQLKVALFVDHSGGGCGSTHQPSGEASAKPGDSVDYVLQVANAGPGDANNVHTQIDLPADTHYEATPCIDFDQVGAIRLQAVDPEAHSTSPSWGSWHLDPPTSNADGTLRRSFVAIHFRVAAGGNPGDYKLTPTASGDSSDGDVSGGAEALHIGAAPDLRVSLSVSPSTITRSQDPTYRITVDNFGTGPARGVNLFLTLPSGIAFLRTEQIAGNASRSGPTDPTTGALVVYYGGFIIPARSESTPGRLEVTVHARCATCIGGSFRASVQLTDADGTAITAADQAPLSVDAPASLSTPTPSPGPGGGTGAGSSRPTPSATASPTPKPD